MFRTSRRLLAASFCLWATALSAAESARVELTIGADTRGAAATGQQWLEVLTDAGVDGLQVRVREPGEAPEVN